MLHEAYLKDIRWASYSSYEGPFYPGAAGARYRASTPTDRFWRKALDVLVAVESGGRYNAVNMYDRCIITTGLVQWCEAANLFGTTKLLGALADKDRAVVVDHIREMPVVNIDFRRGPNGWRFYRASEPVETREDQRRLFLGGATGYKGQWEEGTKKHARQVAAVLAALLGRQELWSAHEAHAIQYLHSFMLLPWARNTLFPDQFPEDKWEGALRAGFVSYAANLPGTAVQQLKGLWDDPGYHKLSARERCIEGLKALTFGPKIAIYPIRYNAIRPVLERLFGVDLPDFATELEKFRAEHPGARAFPNEMSIQQALIDLGYDLGPRGADGRIGPISREAIRQFKALEQLSPVDGGLSEEFLVRLYQKHKELST